MPESDIEFPFKHTGEFTITTGLAGAPTLRAMLSVPRNSSTVTGRGLLTQAINPPLHANTAFHGLVTQEVFGGQSHQMYSLQGVPSPPHTGASYVTQLAITLEGIWAKTGKASYSYLHGGGHGPIQRPERAGQGEVAVRGVAAACPPVLQRTTPQRRRVALRPGA